MNKLFCRTILLSTILALTGCTQSFGPKALDATYPAYSEALTRVFNEQMLLNMVRMRYRDEPCFLNVNTIDSSHTLETSAELMSAFKDTLPANQFTEATFTPKVGVKETSTPKIIYSPVQGEESVKKFYRPIHSPVIYHMLMSGWKADRIFNICVERANNIVNVPSASGPTPDYAPEYKNFKHFSELLRRLQKHDIILIGKTPKEFGTEGVCFMPNDEMSADINEVKKILGLDPDLNKFKLKYNFLDLSDRRITLRLRSLMGVMFYLSHQIEIPKVHREKGLATITKNADGSDFDWNLVTGEYFHVKCSKTKPRNVFLTVHYRGHWYYIDDNDHTSKATMMFVNALFTLQASNMKNNEPIITIGL